jgi:hypothetical protein
MVKQVTDRDPVGWSFGQDSTDLITFYGGTPVVQPSLTQMVTPVLSQVATSGKWGFSSSTAAYLIFTRLRSLVTKLDTLNLVNKL